MLPPQALYAFALEREARPFRRRSPEARIIVTGAGPRQSAAFIAKAFDIERPSSVVITGFAGALIAELQIGDIVVANDVVDAKCEGIPLVPHSRFSGARGDHRGRLLTADRIIGNPEEKRSLAQRYQAVAVDMETAAIARVCEINGIPWTAVRVISDLVDTALSLELMDVLSSGSVSLRRTLATVIRKPSMLAEFRRLASDTRLAAERLAAYFQSVDHGKL